MELLDSLKKCLTNWTLIPLNLVNRLLLVKIVLQAMSTYLSSTLAAPKFILKEIRNMQQKFLWSCTYKQRKWSLVNWETIYTPKHQGGLGFRYQENASMVSGAKLWWRSVSHAHEPWERMWYFKYAEGWEKRELISFSEDVHGSEIWRITWRGRNLI